MESSLTQPAPRKFRILVAPLDWGLGHATRCIPIINELLKQGCEVVLAAEGKQQELLSKEFAEITLLPLQGYRVQYGKSKRGLLWKILLQVPGLIKKIHKEHKWLKDVAEKNNIDAVISDNRYGLYHHSIPTVFITHQLLIKTGIGKWADRVLQKKNYKYINRFTKCWVPDNEINGLCGELSHPEKKPQTPVEYIGAVSRFFKKEISVLNKHLLILLSGPEPQRTLLEEKIINEVSNYQGTATIVRGLPGEGNLIPSTNMIKFYNHLATEDLNIEMQKAEYIIARSGYSTIMDIAALQKKSILIPTPGQTEQEYLSDLMKEKSWAVTFSQEEFDLVSSLNAADVFNYKSFIKNNEAALEFSVRSFLQSLISR